MHAGMIIDQFCLIHIIKSFIKGMVESVKPRTMEESWKIIVRQANFTFIVVYLPIPFSRFLSIFILPFKIVFSWVADLNETLRKWLFRYVFSQQKHAHALFRRP